MADFVGALEEVRPAFGAVTETLEQYRLNGIINYGERFEHLMNLCASLVQQVRAAIMVLLCAWLTSQPAHRMVKHLSMDPLDEVLCEM